MRDRGAFAELVRSFHTLAAAPGVRHRGDDIDLATLDLWASHDPGFVEWLANNPGEGSPYPGEGARHAARFILNLWSTREPWRSGKFDVFEALSRWDDSQAAAFKAWATNPWRP